MTPDPTEWAVADPCISTAEVEWFYRMVERVDGSRADLPPIRLPFADSPTGEAVLGCAPAEFEGACL